MSEGLSVSDVVNVDINLSPKAASTRNFGSLLLLGNTDVIAVGEAPREYSGIEGVSTDFGVDDPEYAAANNFFSQMPRPNTLYIARWPKTASSGKLHGGMLSKQERNVANFNGISNGALTIKIDDSEVKLTGIDLTSATSLNGVASAVTDQLNGDTKLVWDDSYHRFVLTSGTTGQTSKVGYATKPSSGTNLGTLLKLDEEDASAPLNGHDAQDLDQTVQDIAEKYTGWYGLAIADADVSDDAVLATADVIEAQSVARVFGVTTADAKAVDANATDDLASKLKGKNVKRTACQYSSSDPYAMISAMGRAFTTDYTGQNTVITLKFKQEPGVAAELLNESQAQALDDKNCNVFVKYNNDTAILQQGVMCNGDFFDERHGLDWLQNYIQTNLFNLLYQAQTKIPQTDQGVNQLQTNVESSCAQAVRNGLLAPGKWTSSVQFGSLATGDMLSKGYYTHAGKVANQSAADREARKAPTIQVAASLAGAVHQANVVVNVSR